MGGSVAKLGAGRPSKGRLGSKGEAAGAGHGRLTRGRRSSTPQETWCPRSGGNRDHPQCPRVGAGLYGTKDPRGPEGGRRAEGGGGPAASAAPSPRVSARDTPSPGSRRCHSRRRQAVTSPELRRGTQPPPAGGSRGQRRGSSAAGPGNRLRLQRCSGTDTDPRGRHDGLEAALQRGQAPPLTPPPATSCALLAGTRALPAPLSGTPPRPLLLISQPARTWPRTTF